MKKCYLSTILILGYFTFNTIAQDIQSKRNLDLESFEFQLPSIFDSTKNNSVFKNIFGPSKLSGKFSDIHNVEIKNNKMPIYFPENYHGTLLIARAPENFYSTMPIKKIEFTKSN